MTLQINGICMCVKRAFCVVILYMNLCCSPRRIHGTRNWFFYSDMRLLLGMLPNDVLTESNKFTSELDGG